MKILNEQEKRDSLNKVLIDLSKSQDILKEPKDRVSFFKQLESIYYNSNENEENFRHFYSDIFSTLTLIDADSSIGSLDILAQNIQTIKDGYTSKNVDEKGKPINIEREIIKLYDHTNLDIARINYTNTITNETRSQLNETECLVTELETRSLDEEKQLEQLSSQIKKQEDMQKEYITILGIFAAIVLAFTGGMTFSSSVLENIDKSSVYKIAVIALIIGLVFFNLIWLLIDFIRDINGKQIRKKWLWVLVNLILVIGIVGICFSYKYDWFAKNRNQRIESVSGEKEVHQNLKKLKN